MKRGDLVRIKDSYRPKVFEEWMYGLHIILYESPEGSAPPSSALPYFFLHLENGDKIWLEGYKLEVVNEAG
jgi:hypothetical protein